MALRYLSVCSGIEAATMAWHPLGWTPVAFSEVATFPAKVLAHRYPNVPNWGDMTKFQEWPDATVDVLCGGTPCQSFSVAGLRQGLADPRGNLMLTYGAIAGRYRPRWLVWENVPGVLSSNGGRDFAAFLGLLGELGYGWAYRVLDAQHVRTRRFPFAVPQRRRRVWVVGYLGDWRRAAAVLFDRESLSGHPAPRRETGQRPAPTISARPTGGGGLGTDFALDGGLIANSGDVGYCLTASAQQSLDAETETETLIAVAPVAGSLCADAHPGSYSGQDAYTGRLVAHALRGEGHAASEDGTGRGVPIIATVFNPKMGGHPTMGTGVIEDGSTFTLDTDCRSVAIVIQERAVSENLDASPGGSGISDEGASYTLEARNKVQAVAAPLTAGMGASASRMPHEQGALVPVAFDLRGREGGAMPEGPHDTANIRAADGGSSRSYVAQPWAVRRLTPRECERLQGFPDDFTKIPSGSGGGWRVVDETEDVDDLREYGMALKMKGNVWWVRDPDGPRYKALGNSWAVNQADWLGERIAEVDTW